MELAGHECVGFCEFDLHAVASYTMMHLANAEQRKYIESIPAPLNKRGIFNMKARQKEILKEEYRNGEWYANDIRNIDVSDIPYADCWYFGFPCQDISIAGKQLGFNGSRSSLFFAVTKLIKDLEEENRPKYLFIENVKNILSVNRGLGFAKLLIELDEIGYDSEWQTINSKDYVPQNRERVFIIGHLRGSGTRKVFPLERANVENSIRQLVLGPQGQRIYTVDGLSVTLSSQGGGQGPKTGLYAIPLDEVCKVGNTNPCGHGMNGNIYDAAGLCPVLHLPPIRGRAIK